MNSRTLEDLSFLDSLFPDLERPDAARYRDADWRKDEFEDPQWECVFGKDTVRIDWNVPLGSSGSLLTAVKHRELWTALRCWLVLSVHPDVQGGGIWSDATRAVRFRQTLDLIDLLLLRADQLGLPEHGIKALSTNDLIGLLTIIASERLKTDSIYEFPSRVTAFLRTLCLGLTPEKVETLVAHHPFLAADLPPPSAQVTSFTHEELVRVRAYLWDAGFYERADGQVRHMWQVPPSRLVPLVYPTSLRRHRGKYRLPELALVPTERPALEFPRARVTSRARLSMSRPRFGEYENALSRLGLLANVGIEVPLAALRAVDSESLARTLALPENGRYRSVPPDVVLHGLQNAISFILARGDDVVDGYLAAVEDALSDEATLDVTVRAYKRGGKPPSLERLGVMRWTVAELATPPRHRTGDRMITDYHGDFRRNAGLWDLIRVLFGAVQLLVGGVMARRISELYHLKAGSCLDATGKYLLFANAKSGVDGNRETLARPIPPVATRAIRLLERLQDSMIELGTLEEATSLFSYPGSRSGALVALTKFSYNESLDYFCDYIEMPLDDEGCRYYLRQHQLRRFFAMMFFWSNSFGGLDTLREFLGHTDAEHLYRYITESTPGEVLMGIKAEWAAASLKASQTASDALAEVVEKHFGTREFMLLDSDELIDYVETLMRSDHVTIEPEFLDAHGKYRIAIVVREEALV